MGVLAGFRFPPLGRQSMNEIIRNIVISRVEYVIFGADASELNTGIDANARALNNKVLDELAKTLKSNPTFRVRIEGYANPVRNTEEEKPELQKLSLARAASIKTRLAELGVKDGQMVLAKRAGVREASVSSSVNLNRRVELMIIQMEE
jgi:outer membrane protein OmpA-like peptidoglycan-associated protein